MPHGKKAASKTPMGAYGDGCRATSISTGHPTRTSRRLSSRPTSRPVNASGSRHHSRPSLPSLERMFKSASLNRVALRSGIQALSPGTNPGLRLPRSFVMELGRVRADDLPHDLARDPQLSANLLYRLAQREIGPAYFGDRLHNQHSNPGLPESRKASVDPTPRGPDWMKISPVAGSLFHEK